MRQNIDMHGLDASEEDDVEYKRFSQRKHDMVPFIQYFEVTKT